MQKYYYVYIMTNQRNTVLYTGITNNIERRNKEHKEKMAEGFTKKYNINKLVYGEEFNNVEEAIIREKQIKAGSRKKKLDLIKSVNPEFKELSF